MFVYGAGAAWSRLFLPGAGADPIWSEPESAPTLGVPKPEPPKKVAYIFSFTLIFYMLACFCLDIAIFELGWDNFILNVKPTKTLLASHYCRVSEP